MPRKPKVPAIGEALRGTVAYAVRSREGFRAGLRDAHSARLHAPAPEEHARRFLFGFTLPVTLMRIAWGDAGIRRSIVKRLVPPLACVALFAVIGIGSMVSDLVDARHQPLALAAHSHDDDDDDDRDKVGSVAPPASPAATRFPVLHAVTEFVESKLAKLIATLSVLEWILVWIGREHHDQISYDIAQLTGVPGEPLSRPPRLRFDVAWLKMKGWRALRFLIFVALASPVAWVAGKVPHAGEALAFVVEGAWAAYWACVFGIGNSFLVWERPVSPEDAPWFIRALRQASRVPLAGIVFALYARVLTIATRNVWPACMAFERTAWESAGLAALRGLASMPVVYIITRPVFGPAATHAWVARAPAQEPAAYRLNACEISRT